MLFVIGFGKLCIVSTSNFQLIKSFNYSYRNNRQLGRCDTQRNCSTMYHCIIIPKISDLYAYQSLWLIWISKWLKSNVWTMYIFKPSHLMANYIHCKNWSMIFIQNCHWNHTNSTVRTRDVPNHDILEWLFNRILSFS